MVGGISAMSPYISTSYQYMGYGRINRVQSGQSVSAVPRARASIGVGAALAVGRSASPGTPVEPVRPVSTVEADAPRGIGYMIPFLREGMDPAELAVRMRIRYVDPASIKNGAVSGETGIGNAVSDGTEAGAQKAPAAGLGVDEVRKAAQEGECQTCKERKYQDGSDDAGVSYKTPTRIAPEQAAAAVRGHEMEHVVRERAAAEREDRRVVSQSVTMHTAICPECGRVYVSGGTTRTTTAADAQPEQPVQQTDNGESVAA